MPETTPSTTQPASTGGTGNPHTAGRPGPGSQLLIGLGPDGVALVRRDGWFSKRYLVLSDQPLPALATHASGSTQDKALPADAPHAHNSNTTADAPHAHNSNTTAEARQSAAGVAPAHEVAALCRALQHAVQAASCDKMTTNLIMADDWARYFMVAPPKNAVNMADCRAAANMRFSQLYGEAASDWQIHAEWDVQNPFLACALPNGLLTQMQQSLAPHKLHLASVTPFFIACWNRWCKNLQDNAWFGVVNGGFLTLAAIGEQRLQAVRRSPFSLANWQDKQYLPTLLQREALRLNLAMPATLQLCGNLPDARASEIMGSLECKRLDAPLMPDGSAKSHASGPLTLAMAGARP